MQKFLGVHRCLIGMRQTLPISQNIDVLPNEAEEVITNNPLDLNYEVRNGEIRFRQVGETRLGRILAVVSTERKGLTRIITRIRRAVSCATPT